MILDHALTFAIGCFALALLLNLIRFATAPGFADRVLAVDTMTVNVTARSAGKLTVNVIGDRLLTTQSVD